jgi:hypothetical protein
MPVTITSTTFPAAVDAVTNRVTLAAGTAARGWILVCDGECMLVQGQVPGSGVSALQVLRGWDGTAATPHKAAAVVLVGPRSYFGNGYDRSGAYIAANEVAVPSVNVTSGNHFVDSSGVWDQTIHGGNVL